MTGEPEESAIGFRRVYFEWKEREFDNGVAVSTGGTAGRVQYSASKLELPEVSTMVTSGISVGDIPKWCRVDGNRQW